MAQNTQYYNLEKPEGSDLLSPEPFNRDLDTIDSTLHNLSLSIGSAQPWVELVRFEESNFTVGSSTTTGETSVDYYRNFSNQSNTIEYYDKLFLMVYFKGSAINFDSSSSRKWLMQPSFFTDGTLTSSSNLYGVTMSKSATAEYDRLWRNESFMNFTNLLPGSLEKQSNFWFPILRKPREYNDGWDLNTDENQIWWNCIDYKPGENGFGFHIITGSKMKLTVEQLKVGLYGQRTYGDMRF